MHPLARAASVFISCAAFALAGPTEESILATMRLSDSRNYSWESTVVDDARTYEIEGQTERDGYTRVRMPLVNAVRRRLGRSATDTRADAIFKGNVRLVLLTDEHWKTIDELPAALDGEPEEDFPTSSMGSISGPFGGMNSVPGMGAVTRRHRKTIDPSEPQAYSNLQLAISHPHEELGVIVSTHTGWRFEPDGTITGALNELGAQLFLVHDGQDQITPLRAAATFRLWIHGGSVLKYQVSAEGVLSVTSSAGRRKIAVRQTSTTIIKDVDTTKFDVPDEAKVKLGS